MVVRARLDGSEFLVVPSHPELPVVIPPEEVERIVLVHVGTGPYLEVRGEVRPYPPARLDEPGDRAQVDIDDRANENAMARDMPGTEDLDIVTLIYTLVFHELPVLVFHDTLLFQELWSCSCWNS